MDGRGKSVTVDMCITWSKFQSIWLSENVHMSMLYHI